MDQVDDYLLPRSFVPTGMPQVYIHGLLLSYIAVSYAMCSMFSHPIQGYYPTFLGSEIPSASSIGLLTAVLIGHASNPYRIAPFPA